VVNDSRVPSAYPATNNVERLQTLYCCGQYAAVIIRSTKLYLPEAGTRNVEIVSKRHRANPIQGVMRVVLCHFCVERLEETELELL
jgi:hypothetical protein